ncbi:hypothetical protein [Candidatus Nanopusillus massiliensis]|uniref:hypothetical protein n=1 Tax=Candidatus Nanopusillus massiliensis TaxID=2897163 RepID=UPI001E29B111|nr:hypothetical protein [Candidatus Nanopusillus massiliensis]
MSAGIKYGFDKTMRSYYIGKNLLFGTIFYVIFSIIGILIVYTVFGPYLPINITIMRLQQSIYWIIITFILIIIAGLFSFYYIYNVKNIWEEIVYKLLIVNN